PTRDQIGAVDGKVDIIGAIHPYKARSRGRVPLARLATYDVSLDCAPIKAVVSPRRLRRVDRDVRLRPNAGTDGEAWDHQSASFSEPVRGIGMNEGVVPRGSGVVDLRLPLKCGDLELSFGERAGVVERSEVHD